MNPRSQLMVSRIGVALFIILHLIRVGSASAQLIVLDEFNPGLGTLVSIGFESSHDRVWLYDDFNSEVFSYTRAGEFLSAIAAPGEPANDVDIDFATEELIFSDTTVPAGSMLFINGESGVAEIYAVNPEDGEVRSILNTAFGSSHIVGGAYHPERDSLFLVQDRISSSGDDANRIAEIDPVTGDVLNSFSVLDVLSSFSVNFGDIDAYDKTGHLFLVSNIESIILEMSPSGDFVREWALPEGVSSLSGIAIDDARDELFLAGTSGMVWRVGFISDPVSGPGLSGADTNAIVDAEDLAAVRNFFGSDSVDQPDGDVIGEDNQFIGGIIGASHLATIRNFFGSDYNVSNAIPEPASLLWVALGGVLICRRSAC